MPKIGGADERESSKASKNGPVSMPKHSKGMSGSGKASDGTRCQKCEKYGLVIYAFNHLKTTFDGLLMKGSFYLHSNSR